MIITRDDNLLLSAQKVSTGKKGRLPFCVAWQSKTHIKIGKDDNPIIAGYYNPDILDGHQEKFFSIAEYRRISGKKQKKYIPYYVKEIVTPDRAVWTFQGNNVCLSLPKKILNRFPRRSRYWIAFRQFRHLEAIGVIAYTGKATTPRHRTEALRQHFKRKFRPVLYEHNILIYGAIGKALLRHCRKGAARKYPTTAYLKDNPKTETMLKIYNVTAYQEGRETNGADDEYKLELTFRGSFFKSHSVSIQQLKKQKDIQILLMPRLIKEYRALFNGLPYRIQTAFRKEMGIRLGQDITGAILKT